MYLKDGFIAYERLFYFEEEKMGTIIELKSALS